ncbi:UvrABC system protein C [Bacteroidia bacterium]|nr:UvrABC system protein C [Bacteroidia bacterium]
MYVGKAKNLKSRVNSYFTKQEENPKRQIMVSKIENIKYTVVKDEQDAFFLENTLIKQYQPRYNTLLKDDKSYPSICVTNEPFPQVFATRQIKEDGSKYFGPYASARSVHNLLTLIQEMFSLRTCRLKLDASSIEQKKYQSCLELDIKNCCAPCIGKQTQAQYNESIKVVIDILKGHFKRVKETLSQQMLNAAQSLNFEQAHTLQQHIALIEKFSTKSLVVNTSAGSVDVFFLQTNNKRYYCSFLRTEDGTLVYSHTFEVNSPIETDLAKILSVVVMQVKEKLQELSPIVVVPFVPSDVIEDVAFMVPAASDKLKLLQLAQKNCNAYIAQRVQLAEQTNPNAALEEHLTEMKTRLQLSALPYHIECFDNSNIQGTHPVASCVVFKRAKPSKKDYRLFTIKTVVGANDFASMQEIITRRYTRMLNENIPLPQLIVVDGGKGQLSAAYEALQKLDLTAKIDIIGLAKRLEEVFVPYHETPLYLSKKEFSLKVLMQLRDEAHRFAITFHRKKRSKGMVQHPLSHIEGLGKTSVDKLLLNYKTIANIKNAGYDDVCQKIGTRVANILLDKTFFD